MFCVLAWQLRSNNSMTPPIHQMLANRHIMFSRYFARSYYQHKSYIVIGPNINRMALIATISSPSIRRKFIDLPRLLNRHGVGTKHVGDWQRY